MAFKALEVSKNHAYVAPVTDTLAGAVDDTLFTHSPPPGVVVVSTDGIAVKDQTGAWKRILWSA